jgi:acetyl esterase/lipase
VTPIVETCSIPDAPSPGDLAIDEDVVFTVAGTTPIRLDLVRPRAAGRRPGVLVFFGGGWKMGGKEHVRRIAMRLAALGFVAAAPDYRLAPAHRFPAQLEDARCALDWLAARSDVDATKLAALGLSAGAHLAELLAVAADVDIGGPACARGVESSRLALALAYYGPHDLRAGSEFSRASRDLVELLLGGPPDRNARLAELASPIVHVSAGDAPVLLIHGARDVPVPIGESRRMAEALHAARVPATLVELPDAGHGFSPFDDAPRARAATCTMLGALERRLGATTRAPHH